MDSTLKRFLRTSGVFFLDGAITGALTSLVTGDPFSPMGLKIMVAGALTGGLTSLRRYLKSLEASIVMVEEKRG